MTKRNANIEVKHEDSTRAFYREYYLACKQMRRNSGRCFCAVTECITTWNFDIVCSFHVP